MRRRGLKWRRWKHVDADAVEKRSDHAARYLANRVLLPLARANEADANTMLDALRQEPLSEEHGITIPYSTLTHLLRNEQLRTPALKRSGLYHYEPGAEMQHDTSPHRIEIGGKTYTAQRAGLILPFSRYAFIQYYPAFTRFDKT
jgi:hypothetical protein